MKLEDAPTTGWYPDPERGGQLRWWEGTDWTNSRRSIPSAVELNASTGSASKAASTKPAMPTAANLQAQASDGEKFVIQAREAAREEVERAADLFSRRARVAADRARSVLGEYVDRVLRWIKIAAVVIAVAVIAWFIFQFIVQATLLEWLGDRIDNVTDS